MCSTIVSLWHVARSSRDEDGRPTKPTHGLRYRAVVRGIGRTEVGRSTCCMIVPLWRSHGSVDAQGGHTELDSAATTAKPVTHSLHLVERLECTSCRLRIAL